MYNEQTKEGTKNFAIACNTWPRQLLVSGAYEFDDGKGKFALLLNKIIKGE